MRWAQAELEAAEALLWLAKVSCMPQLCECSGARSVGFQVLSDFGSSYSGTSRNPESTVSE